MRGAHWVGAVALLTGCYVGLPTATGDPSPAGDDGGSDEPSSDAGDAPRRAATEDDCGPIAVGESAMLRLSRDEYARAVRDLFGVTVDVSGLPGDGRVGPFAMNAHVAVSTDAATAYRILAEDVAARVVDDLAALLPCDEGDTSDECATELTTSLLRRAYRRPVTDAEIAQVYEVFSHGRDADGFAFGITLTIEAILQSPKFLYRIEQGKPDPSDPFLRQLDDYEIASRLSFMLWGTIPDDALLEAAQLGQLTDPTERENVARQMLLDPRARDGVGRLYAQMFGAAQVHGIERDPEAFPTFSPALAAEMEREVASTAASLVLDDGAGLDTLLVSPRSILSPELAELYGAPIPEGAEPVTADLYAVELPPDERAGLLTRAAVMASLSHFDQSAPVQRADFVFREIACRPPAPPPSDVDSAPADVDPDATGRQQLEMRTADPQCRACHEYLNALGFGFEHYDAVGAYRELDGGQPVDASGELLNLDVSGPFDGAIELSAALALSDDVRRCLLGRHATVAYSHPLDTDTEACLAQQLEDAYIAEGTLIDFLVTLVARPEFGFRRVAQPSAPEEE